MGPPVRDLPELPEGSLPAAREAEEPVAAPVPDSESPEEQPAVAESVVVEPV